MSQATPPRGKFTYPLGLASVEEPGLLESLIPFWGSGRGLIADMQQGDYPGATINAILLALDATGGGGIIAKTIKGASMMPKGAKGWKYVRSVYGKEGYIPKGWQGHHAVIPQRWGEHVPNGVLNHPANIKPLPVETHQRLHRRWNGKPRYDPVTRTWIGSPWWAQAFEAGAVGRPGEWIHDGRRGNGALPDHKFR